MTGEHFRPDAKGWVVRRMHSTRGADGAMREHASWWYGADHGFGTTSGGLDYYGVPLPIGSKVMRVVDAVAYELERLEASRLRVLEGDRKDRQEIAESCERSMAYLRGERTSPR